MPSEAGVSSVQSQAQEQTLTDSVDESIASDTLLESLGEESVPNVAQRTLDALTTFEKLKFQYDRQIIQSVEEAIFPSVEQNEEYLKSISAQLYAEIHKQAKSFLKTWCKINGYEQHWGSPFKTPTYRKKLSYNSEFNPQVYSIRVCREAQSQVIADMMPTPREALIFAAKTLGFDSSNERKLAFAKFSSNAIEKILADPRYLREQKELHKFQEYLRQIDSRRYVPQSLRDKWRAELEKQAVIVNGEI